MRDAEYIVDSLNGEIAALQQEVRGLRVSVALAEASESAAWKRLELRLYRLEVIMGTKGAKP
jgi:uncharacterized small protein (DUF1192 family)